MLCDGFNKDDIICMITDICLKWMYFKCTKYVCICVNKDIIIIEFALKVQSLNVFGIIIVHDQVAISGKRKYKINHFLQWFEWIGSLPIIITVKFH